MPLEVDQIVAAIVDRHVAAALESVAVAVERRATNYAEGDALVQRCVAVHARAGRSARRTPLGSSAPTSRPPPPSGTTEGGDGTKQQGPPGGADGPQMEHLHEEYRMKPQRVTPDRIEELARNSGCDIEIDDDTQTAHLKVGRHEYVAALETEVPC